MGWVLVNILLPISLPLGFLLLVKLVELEEKVANRAKLLRAVQDGQLSWVAMGFAASTTYEMFEAMVGGKAAPSWPIGIVFSSSALILASAGLIATLGTLYPVDNALEPPATWGEWVVRYRLFVVSAIATGFTACLYGLVHFAYPNAV